ncbi:MAG TPA: outer membrane beta-barrel protein [Gemmatimonadales bacterium]|nr:outer membrane beta-barrel protein [Gemmatimonadales bacterium]
MKRLILLAGFLTLVANPSPVAAQKSQALEFSGFGSWWRFDRSFLLENHFGGGARVGYNLSDRVSLEAVGDFVQTTNLAGTQDVKVQTISANLVLNFPASDHFTITALGGYSHMTFGPNAPYDFTQHLIGGGLGFRGFLSPHVAIHGDVRAQYRPDNPFFSNAFTGQVQASLGASYFFVPPQQGKGWNKNYQWYWGAQGGAFISKTNTEAYAYDPIVGGHWLITARRTALYVAYEQSFFLSDAHAVIFDPNSSTSSVGPGFRDVTFSDVRRFMFGVLAFPSQKVIEPFGGGGFALMQVLNPSVDCSSCATLGEAEEAANRVHDASSKAFFWLMGGLQINYSSRFNVFAHYLLTSSAQEFLLDGNTHSLQAGLRYSLGTAKEGITSQH